MVIEIKGVVTSNRRIQSVYYQLEIQCPPLSEQVKPGQFVMLRVGDNASPLLKRPFSVYKSYPARHSEPGRGGHLVIFYKNVGKGTRKMTAYRKGEVIELIGPLGNGFRLPPLPSSRHSILIGGGAGIVSLYSLAEVLQVGELFVFIGGRTKQDILCAREVRKLTPHVYVASEDGVLGFKGTVVDLFRSKRGRFQNNISYDLYACGPMAMLRALSREAESGPFLCQASLETRMACGFGACYGCVVKTKDPHTPYHRVCKEGPVFDLHQILWDDSS